MTPDVRVERVRLSDLAPDPGNPRVRTDRGRIALAESLREYGPARSAVIDGKGILRAGHGTVEAARAVGLTDAIVIDAPEDALVVVRKRGWTEAQAKGYVVADNHGTDLSFFADDLLIPRMDELTELDFPLTKTLFSTEELDLLMLGGDESEKKESREKDDAPDGLFGPWESDNEWGVPTLRLDRQATDLPRPVMKWGGRRRADQASGSYHFYAEDYKFWGLRRNPLEVVKTGVRVAFEPNFSTWPEMSRAEALWWIYSKRVIARYWQERGIHTLVDLNVDGAFLDLWLLGVPLGWRAYSTRWQRETTEEDIEVQEDAAIERAGTQDILFVVVGGGVATARLCLERGWIHVAEDSHTARGIP